MSNKQDLKELYFKNENKLFSKKSKFLSYTCKDTTQILSNIANKPRFNEIRKRYKVEKLLSNILLNSHYNWVLYAFYRNDILYIATANHIGQSELNLQKIDLKKYLQKTKDFAKVKSINIFRDEKYKKSTNNKRKQILSFKEQSHGIFINELSDKRLYNIVENIRQRIKILVN